MKYKPSERSKGVTAKALAWYAELDHLDKKDVDKKISRVMSHIKGRGRSQFSHANGVELVYKVMWVMK